MACVIPDKIVAGTTFDRLVTATAYPSSEWSARLLLRGPMAIDLVAVADGAAHRFAASAGMTADWPPGRYRWAIRVSRDDDLVEVDSGEVVIGADIDALPAGHDPRGHARKVLDAIEAVIEGRATIDQQKYTINNRELWRTPIADLLLLRSRYREEVRREAQVGRAGQSLLGRQIKVRI
ncbi:hypothetical protein [Paracoccus yeei]|uniref:hypothetical protein n=1 Tax=Paracoccus yeei TaxID=147645 RepID=UPI0028D35D4C|nr:hypothetical protein [Paracoccus yeei]